LKFVITGGREMNTKYEKLFEPFTFKSGVTIKNRLVMAPMTTWASNEDLTVSDQEVELYRQRVNGVGLVITGCTQVTANGQAFTHEFAGYSDEFIPSLKKLADAAKSGGAPALLQIFHGGNKALPEVGAASASGMVSEATPFTQVSEVREMSHEEILDVIHAFGETTRRAIEAGFDGVEIHGAHAFLIQNFYSQATNRREDQWGGSLENRLRFPLAVIAEIKKTIKEHATKPFALGYRFSPEESSKVNGLTMEDTYLLIDRLVEMDLDYIHASLDNVDSKPKDGHSDRTRLELLLEKIGGRVPLMAAGTITTPDEALKVADLGLQLIAIGKALIINPQWVEMVESGRENEITMELEVSKRKELAIPDKLWAIIDTTPNWFVLK
jgi:2,4-dienoyl-CoA reductase-like NADH-dependent reductase (Old Yellow Enzyme family)